MLKRHALVIGVALLGGSALASGARAYEWGGGSCVGHGCVQAIQGGGIVSVDDDDDDDDFRRGDRRDDRRSFHSDRRYDRDGRHRHGDHDDRDDDDDDD